MMKHRTLYFRLIAFNSLLLLLLAGCSRRDLELQQGKILFSDGTAFAFAGDVLEVRPVGQLQGGFAEIQADGSFAIETLEDGTIFRGCKPGTYEARIVVSDDDYDHKAQAAIAINEKYLQFESSGLRFELPTPELQLRISK
jgi:hypothetical protein